MISPSPAASQPLTPAAAYARIAGFSLAVAGLTLAVGYFPTLRVAGPGVFPEMAAGALAALFIALLAAAPLALSLGKTAQQRGLAALQGIAIRFIAALIALVAAVFLENVNRKVLLVWILIPHIALLVADTLVLRWLLQRADARQAAA